MTFAPNSSLRSPLAAAAARALESFERRLPPAQTVDPVTARRRTIATLTVLGTSLALGWASHERSALPRDIVNEPDVSIALSRALIERKNLTVDPTEIYWLDEAPFGFKSRAKMPRAMLRAHEPGEPADIYLVETRWSPEGRLLQLGGVYNITDTSAVDEQELTVSDARAAWTLGTGGKIFSVEYADLRGVTLPDSWGRLAVWQQRITQLQNTGSSRGIARSSYKLDPAPARVRLGLSSDSLLIEFDQHTVRIPTEGAGVIEGQRFVNAREHQIARPGNLVTWAVDRVRAIPAFGDERMQWFKAIAFAGLDRVERWMGDVTGDDGAETIAENMGELMNNRPTMYTDPATGWPPAPMEPMLTSVPIPGEGKWVSLGGDPFVRGNPRVPNPFVFSFIRTDRERVYSQIYVLVWDPRQVELHAVSGTVEPKSATGETGTGLVPREPKVMRRLVGAFNGGFQAQHGAFGMVADGVVYLPPKPYAATVAELRDGSTGFGTWPEDTTIPSDLVSFRQNMTPLVSNGELNPYHRHWWGGTPPGWSDEARTVRSGLCMTREGFVGYFYGNSVDPTHLGVAMQRARCVYGVHLDMNPGHVGFEFFHAGPVGSLPAPGHTLDETWEARGSVAGMPGWDFLGRRMIKNMALMNFPRYIQREQRDFFYLTLRDLVGAHDAPTAVEPREAEEGHWHVDGLPQFGWPYVIATTSVRPDVERRETSVRLLELDPRALRVAHGPDAHAPALLTVGAPPAATPGGIALWHVAGRFSVAQSAPSDDADRLAQGYAASDPRAVNAVAAVGITEGGIGVYAEVGSAPRHGADATLLTHLLKQLDCEAILLLDQPLAIAIAGEHDLAGHAAPTSRNVLRIVRAPTGARGIFADTKVVLPSIWAPLQARKAVYDEPPHGLNQVSK